MGGGQLKLLPVFLFPCAPGGNQTPVAVELHHLKRNDINSFLKVVPGLP